MKLQYYESPKIITLFIVSYMILGIISILFTTLNWYVVAIFFLFIAIGDGTVAHRYFSHNSFRVAKWLHWVLAIWATLTASIPISYWITQHRHHHKYTDKNVDIHSPIQGPLKSFLTWIFDAKAIESIFRDRFCLITKASALKDPAVRTFSKYFLATNILFLSAILLISPELLYAISVAFLLEKVRLGLVNYVLHTPRWPGNYTNHSLSNNSQNNIVIGLITLGFGWHNNHHANSSKLILTEKWWELDIEGYIGWILSKSTK